MQQIYEEDNKSALERLGRQGTFKFWALWSIRDGKVLMVPSVHSLYLLLLKSDNHNTIKFIHTKLS